MNGMQQATNNDGDPLLYGSGCFLSYPLLCLDPSVMILISGFRIP
jgi:hypothetical protein